MGLSAGLVEHLLTPLADVWLQVGVWVAALLALFSVGGAHADRVTGLLGRRGWGPVAGALLGVSPGCGGAIVVMPVYAAGRAGFGTVVATLIATMGDSSFVLLAADPALGLAVHASLFALGVTTGLMVDALGLAPLRRHADVPHATPTPGRGYPAAPGAAVSTVGAASMPVGLLGRPAPLRGGLALWLFWLWAVLGLTAAIAVQFAGVTLPTVGWVDPWHLLGVSGTVFAVVVTVVGRRHVRQPGAPPDRARARMAHAARETAAVTTWVMVAFLMFQAIAVATGDTVTARLGHGLLSVLLAAAVGLVPGCGAQILLTTLYTQGAVGLPALLANAVSQDGDALFPLLARERGAALWATVTTTVPALLVGTCAWLILR